MKPTTGLIILIGFVIALIFSAILARYLHYIAIAYAFTGVASIFGFFAVLAILVRRLVGEEGFDNPSSLDEEDDRHPF